ncbi:MAG: EamA family transporter [Methylobacteriaceae bacterium]|nr:EamA family transporter [Methylobacteriaceae bacterium]
MDAIAFALIAALAGGAYSVLQRIAAPGIHQAFGALLISLTAALVSAIALICIRDQNPLYSDVRVLPWLGLIGAAAFSIDYFSLLAYSRGLSVSVGSPIFIGVSIVTASLAGFALGEAVTLMKLLGIGLIVLGAVIVTALA